MNFRIITGYRFSFPPPETSELMFNIMQISKDTITYKRVKSVYLRYKILLIFILIFPVNLLANTVIFEQMTSSGIFSGCSIVFDKIIYDNIYNKGKTRVAGSFTVDVRNSKVFLFKLGVSELNLNNKKLIKGSFDDIYYAYYDSKNFSSSQKEIEFTKSEENNSFLSIYHIEDLLPIFEGNVTISYNRKKNGRDVKFSLDFTNNKENFESQNKFLYCLQEVSL